MKFSQSVVWALLSTTSLLPHLNAAPDIPIGWTQLDNDGSTGHQHIYSHDSTLRTFDVVVPPDVGFCGNKVTPHLATPLDLAKNGTIQAELAKLPSSPDEAWIGGKRGDLNINSGDYHWVTGEEFNYTNWGTDQPSTDPGARKYILMKADGTWRNANANGGDNADPTLWEIGSEDQNGVIYVDETSCDSGMTELVSFTDCSGTTGQALKDCASSSTDNAKANCISTAICGLNTASQTLIKNCYPGLTFPECSQVNSGPDDWDISVPTIPASDNNNTITAMYTISDKPATVSIYNENCVTEVANDGPMSLTYSQATISLLVDVTFDETKIYDNATYTTSNGAGIATIKACLRVDLQSNGESVVFKETNIEITVNLSEGFDQGTSTVALARTGATTAVSGGATLDEAVVAYCCNEDGTATTNTITQFKNARICIEVTTPGTKIYTINSLTCSQDRGAGVFGGTIEAVAGGTVNSISTAAVVPNSSDKKWLITTRFFSSFFYTATPPPVSCAGSATLELSSRKLRGEERGLQTNEVADFSVDVALRTTATAVDSMAADYGVTSNGLVAISALAVAVIGAGI